MSRFPVDPPRARVIKTLELLGFELVCAGEHIAMARANADGSRTPLTLPSHKAIKGSTLRTVCTQAGIPREEFLAAYEKA